jgi:tetratricopeptide (TPR) repeat protein
LALASFSAWLFLAGLQFLYASNLVLEFAFWLMLAASFLALRNLSPENEFETDFSQGAKMEVEFNKTSPLASVLSFVFVVIIVLSISAIYLGGTYYYADVLYKNGVNLVKEKGDIENGSLLISKAVLLNPYSDLYLRDLSEAALARVNKEFNKPQDAARDTTIQNLIATAINIAKRSTDLSPLNVDNWVQRASVYRAVMLYTADADKWAIDSYSEAVKLEPQNPYYYYELGRTYNAAAELLASATEDKEKVAKRIEYVNKAEEAFKKAVELKSDYAPALYQLAVISDLLGKSDEAIQRMKETQALYPNDTGVAFQLGVLYYKKTNWDLSAAQLERAIALDANYSNARYFLGLIYDKQGKIPEAIQQFEKIAALNPGNQDVENILANLRAGKPALGTALPEGVPIGDKTPQQQ